MQNDVVSHEEWTKARKKLLAKEKEFTRLRDELSAERQSLPFEKVEKDYEFEGPDGKVSLADLFGGNDQLIVYHFMYGPDWDEGCKSCSYLADHFNPAIPHLDARNVSFVAASRAPLDKLQAYKKRLKWDFPWVSSLNSDFNQDYQASYSKEEVESGKAYHNYENGGFSSTEAPGASVFFKAKDGTVYHTYSVYSRGLDMFITAYHYLDIVPKGRDEDGLDFSMGWLKRNDEY